MDFLISFLNEYCFEYDWSFYSDSSDHSVENPFVPVTSFERHKSLLIFWNKFTIKITKFSD
ncbi:hypothetical protein BKM63_01400 [Flavobacterium johnsoniae]|uniref:Uncharacterized protein n=1 Tax=Flavobacterium johnsoniae TaxID=986 RepID=A0A1J7CDH5_FLAJO|nr:hypothetical protein BKM63_01400 [Flavobacterium johnsoniae]